MPTWVASVSRWRMNSAIRSCQLLIVRRPSDCLLFLFLTHLRVFAILNYLFLRQTKTFFLIPYAETKSPLTLYYVCYDTTNEMRRKIYTFLYSYVCDYLLLQSEDGGLGNSTFYYWTMNSRLWHVNQAAWLVAGRRQLSCRH